MREYQFLAKFVTHNRPPRPDEPPGQHPEPAAEAEAPDWLGVYVYTPHYRPVTFAVRPSQRDAATVLRLVRRHALGVPDGLFDTVVPLFPQRFDAFASFIRFPSVISGCGDVGSAAIVLDLSRVGGRYFPTVLPRRLSPQALVDYVTPLTWHDDQPLIFYVGCRATPWPPQTEVQLGDGDVITFVRNPDARFARLWFEGLFTPGAIWAPLHHAPRLEESEGICVLFREQRFCFLHHHHPGGLTAAAIVNRLGLSPGAVATCAFPVDDLEVQGEHCPFVLAVAEVLAPGTGRVSRADARDVFLLLDFRPLGLKPRFVHSHYPALHIPSILARFDVMLPPAFQVAVAGGQRRGEDIYVESSQRLLFYAEPAGTQHAWEEASSPEQASSSGEGQPADSVEQLALPVVRPSQAPARRTLEVGDLSDFVRRGAVSVNVSPDALSDQPSSLMVPCSSNATTGGELEQSLIEALVYVPHFLPESYTLRVDFPCGVEQLRLQLKEARIPDRDLFSLCLFPASPQPYREHALFVAVPTWLQDRTVVLCDTRRVDDRLQALYVWRQLSVSSLLRTVGLDPAEDFQVFVHGLATPASAQHLLTFAPGMTVTVLPAGLGAPAGTMLADNLQSASGWDRHAPVQGPPVLSFNSYLLLTDGMPRVYVADSTRRGFFSHDIALTLGMTPGVPCIRAALPRPADVFMDGIPIANILVVTARQARLPCPPAKAKDARIIVFLDQRRVCQGFTWRLLDNPWVEVQPLANQFYDTCPEGHIVSIKGGVVENRDSGPVLLVDDCQILIIDYVEDLSEDGSSRPPSTDGADDPDATEDPDGPDSTDPFDGVVSKASGPLLAARNRSRSPRPTVAPGFGSLAECGEPSQTLAVPSKPTALHRSPGTWCPAGQAKGGGGFL
ncbi:GIP [Symbiodinium sp. CCMP2592]|nr:GIP [Symbiodinium sp. CCMP2592]